jgi:putative peptidoglycan lipid II flippase
LYYSNRVFQLPLALFAIATSVAIFPKISRYLKNNDDKKALNYMKKAFVLLLFLLTFSTIGGIVLSKEIVYLLFQRGVFTSQDTANTALVLQMYMIGLLPFGLNKLFSLWLYASLKQLQVAKIATYSLVTNIILSLAFIIPFGAMGLALASSISGFVGFFYSVRLFGFKRFFSLLNKKEFLYLILGSIILVIILYLFKYFVIHRIFNVYI